MTDSPYDSPLKYRRILLKLSGEALMGKEDYGIDPEVIRALAREIIEAQKAGAQVGLVIGGGTSSAARGWRPPAWTGSPATTWACWPP